MPAKPERTGRPTERELASRPAEVPGGRTRRHSMEPRLRAAMSRRTDRPCRTRRPVAGRELPRARRENAFERASTRLESFGSLLRVTRLPKSSTLRQDRFDVGASLRRIQPPPGDRQRPLNSPAASVGWPTERGWLRRPSGHLPIEGCCPTPGRRPRRGNPTGR